MAQSFKVNAAQLPSKSAVDDITRRQEQIHKLLDTYNSNKIQPPKINDQMLSVFPLGEVSKITEMSQPTKMNAHQYLKKLQKEKPLKINPNTLQQDVKAYIRPIFSSISELEKVTEQITATYFKGMKPEGYDQKPDEILIEMIENEDNFELIDDFMDLVKEAHIKF